MFKIPSSMLGPGISGTAPRPEAFLANRFQLTRKTWVQRFSRQGLLAACELVEYFFEVTPEVYAATSPDKLVKLQDAVAIGVDFVPGVPEFPKLFQQGVLEGNGIARRTCTCTCAL